MELSDRVILNIDFARANLKANIYNQAVLEGVATTFPQTEDIVENGRVNGVSANDVQKILNLKRAAVIFANHYLIGKAAGLLVIPERDVLEFKRLLVAYYEDRDTDKIVGFMKEKCWRRM